MSLASETPTETRVDFHTHSAHSDGVLTPRELVERAVSRSVATLALTDHDTLAGLDEASEACAQHGIRFIRGIEVSARHGTLAVHIIGLAIATDASQLCAHTDRILAQRRERLQEIGARLTKRSQLPGNELAEDILRHTRSPTRLHMARALVAAGFATDIQQAFDRWLDRTDAGHVPIEWPTLADTMDALRSATSVIVMAHPHRYRLSAGQMRQTVATFKEHGGVGLEQSVAGMSPNDADRVASLCRKFDLDASLASDFHDPAIPWNPLGLWLKLPDGLRPITARLE
jgi:3',5'-nucleoside bisphosphate phosphatase